MLIEDGGPFCPQCGPPQIRVSVVIPEAPFETAPTPAYDSSPDASVEPGLASSQIRQTASRVSLDRSVATHAALKAGVLGVFIGVIPFLGIVLTGYLAVFFYRRESGIVPVASLASRVGGAAGGVAFAINALLMTVRIFVFHAQQEYVDFLTQIAHKFGADPSDPAIQAGIHNLFKATGLASQRFFWMLLGVALAKL